VPRKLLPSILGCFLAIFVAGAYLSTGQASAATAYDAGHLMDDAILLNSSSMNIAQIQSFLSSMGGAIANYTSVFDCSATLNGKTFIGQASHDAYISIGAPCGQTVSAATTIYYASQAYGVNPQAVIATMQKEQSLITAATYDSYKFGYAMGFNCPDSTGCSSGSDFMYQLDGGTWALRFRYERLRGNASYWPSSSSQACMSATGYYSPSLLPNQTVSFSDDNGVNYANIPILNAATSSLYCYTPHVFNNFPGCTNKKYSSALPTVGDKGMCYTGSYNFVSAFNAWFGLPYASPLIKGSGPTVYLIGSDPSKAYGVPSGAVLDAYGLSGMQVTQVSDSYIASLNTTGMLTSLFMKPGDGTIYLADGKKMYGIASGVTCTQWGLACSQSNLVSTLPDGITKNLSVQPALNDLMNYNGMTYYLNNGIKHPFLASSDIALSPWRSEQPIGIVSQLNSSQTVGTPEIFSSHFIHLSNGAIYYYDNASSKFFVFNSFNAFTNWWDGSLVINDTISSFNSTPPDASVMPSFALSNGTYYAVNGPVKLSLPSAPSASVLDLGIYTDIKPLIDSKSTVPVDSTHAVRFSNGAIMLLSGGVLHPFVSLVDVMLLVGSNVTNNVPDALSSAYSTGSFAIAPGRLIKLDSTPTLYVSDDNGYLWAIDTMKEVNPILGWMNNGLNVSSANMAIAGYKHYNDLVKVGSSYYTTESNGQLRQLPTGVLSDQKDSLAIPLNGSITRYFKYDTRPDSFIHFDNGTIFAVTSTSIRPVGMNTYASLGGNSNNTIEMPLKALSTFITGDPM
jgi:hypothetical protein